MDDNSTDTQCDKGFVFDNARLWAAMDFQSMLLGKASASKTDEELHDRLGLADKRLDVILSEVRKKHKNES